MLDAISNPIAVVSSKFPGSIIVYTLHDDGTTKKLAAVQIDAQSTVSVQLVDGNKINSNYVIDSGDSLNDAIRMENEKNPNGGVFFWDKEKAPMLMSSEAERLTVSNIDGFNPRITGNNAIVKSDFESQTNTRQFKKWFGDSKVVNKDGSPMILYHGTNEVFTVFDRGDIGFHFGTKEAAESRMLQMHYGDDSVLMPVYLRI